MVIFFSSLSFIHSLSEENFMYLFARERESENAKKDLWLEKLYYINQHIPTNSTRSVHI